MLIQTDNTPTESINNSLSHTINFNSAFKVHLNASAKFTHDSADLKDVIDDLLLEKV